MTSSSPASFAGKTCLVTGAASGLGKVIATHFLSSGANVAICDINHARLSSTSAELAVLCGVGSPDRLLAVETDITSEGACEKLVADVVEKFGRIDVLVNNAGIVDHFHPVGSLEKEEWDRVLAVNITAPFLLSKFAVQHMVAQEPQGGVILNIASVGGVAGFRAGAAYTASKHGLLGLTKNTAAFYAKKNIRCNAILPGGMETNISERLAVGKCEEGYGVMLRTCAVEPSLSPLDKVAQTALFLCSDAASICNGACLTTDGGWLAY